MAVGDNEVLPTAKLNSFIVKKAVVGADAATATNYGKFFIAPWPCTVLRITEVHTTAGDDAGDVTLGVEKCNGTQASGAGTALLTADFNLKGVAETVQVGALSAVAGALYLQRGDRLNLVDTGVLTTLAGVCVTVELMPAVQ